jgi:hypothetical protein
MFHIAQGRIDEFHSAAATAVAVGKDVDRSLGAKDELKIS